MKYLYKLTFLILVFPLILCASGELKTASEKSDFSKLTNYVELTNYLKELASSSNLVTLSTIGKSVEGRNIYALYFSKSQTFNSKEKRSKPLVLVDCQQHGDEPSGKEAALITARYILNNDSYLLNSFDLILIPQANPDGAAKGTRKNANKMDLNRNHVILSEPESIALHRLFLKWMPEITLDIHESNSVKKIWIKNGFIKDAEEMLGCVTNLNIDSNIIDFSKKNIIPETGKLIEQNKIRFHEYIVGSPFKNHRIRYSTTNINDARQSMGIYSTFSFIFEGKRYGDLLTNLKRRTEAQVIALISFFKTIAKHSNEMLEIVNNTRKSLLIAASSNSPRRIAIKMDYFADPNEPNINFPIFDLYTWHHTLRALNNFQPLVKIKKTVLVPSAYILQKRDVKLIKLLQKHQIKLEVTTSNQKIKIQKYKILHITNSMEEDKPDKNIDLEEESLKVTLPKGTVIIPSAQKAANLIPLLLEPQSSYGIVSQRSGRKYVFKNYLKENNYFPIFRTNNYKKLNTIKY